MVVKALSPKLSRQQISIALTIIAILLWSHSVLYANFEIGFWGLIHSLPLTFFLALAILTVASAILWVAKENHGRLLCFQLLLMVCAMWSIPVVIGGSPPVINHAYRNVQYINYIAETGHISAATDIYFSWPGVFFISTPIVLVGALTCLEPLFDLMPLLMQLLYLLPLYLFLRNTLGQQRLNYCWAGCWLFYLAQWPPQDYFSTQGVALLMLLVLLALVTSTWLWQKGPKSVTALSLMVVVFAALTITHLLTSIVALLMIAAFALFKKSLRLMPVIAVFLVLMAGWNLTGAGSVVVSYTSRVLTPVITEPTGLGSLILGPDAMTEVQITSRLTGSPSHIAVGKMRILFSAIFTLIGALGAIWVCLIKREYRVGLPLLAIAVVSLALVPLQPFSYAGEILQRLYILLLAPMAYFGARLLEIRSRAVIPVFCFILALAVPLHLVAYYGNQKLDYYSPAQVAGVEFFQRTSMPGYLTKVYPTGGMSYLGRYSGISLRRLDDFISNYQLSGTGLPHYVGLTRQAEAYYQFIELDAVIISQTVEKLSRSGYNLVYDSSDLRLFVFQIKDSR